MRHGASGYKTGCRCGECREGKRLEMLAYRTQRKAATGLAQGRRASRTYASAELTPCVACGEPLTGKVRSDAPLHNRCRKPRHWSNAIQVSQSERLAIYERDGWTCQLCRESVDRTLDPQDRMAATLDHIAPRSLTLFPDDSPENLRLAHRACNSARGIGAA